MITNGSIMYYLLPDITRSESSMASEDAPLVDHKR